MSKPNRKPLEKPTHQKACPLCRQSRSESVYQSLPSLRRCKACGFVYTAEVTPAEIYTEDYFRGKGGYDFLGSWAMLYDQVRFPVVLSHIQRHVTSGKVLDVGCGTGTFLKFMYDEGYEPYGLDVSAFAVDIVKKQFGFPVVQGTLDSISANWDKFDVITFFHVLEHVEDPISCLANSIRPLLRNDGIALIEVPNFGSIDSRVDGESWEDLKLDQHISHFTISTLKKCVAASGMKVTEYFTYSPLGHKFMWDYLHMLRLLGIPRHQRGRIADLVRAIKREGSTGTNGTEHRSLDEDMPDFCSHPKFPQQDRRGIAKRVLFAFLRLGTAPLASTYCALGLGKFIVMIARPGDEEF